MATSFPSSTYPSSAPSDGEAFGALLLLSALGVGGIWTVVQTVGGYLVKGDTLEGRSQQETRDRDSVSMPEMARIRHPGQMPQVAYPIIKRQEGTQLSSAAMSDKSEERIQGADELNVPRRRESERKRGVEIVRQWELTSKRDMERASGERAARFWEDRSQCKVDEEAVRTQDYANREMANRQRESDAVRQRKDLREVERRKGEEGILAWEQVRLREGERRRGVEAAQQWSQNREQLSQREFERRRGMEAARAWGGGRDVLDNGRSMRGIEVVEEENALLEEDIERVVLMKW